MGLGDGDKLSSVSVTVNGRTYKMACDEGQEKHLLGLAAHVNGLVDTIKQDVGQVGDTRLLLMAAIMIADELNEANRRGAALEDEVAALTSTRDSEAVRHRDAEAAAARTLNAAAQRVELMARQIGPTRK